ncbi:hypothetical protein [Caballeronia sp. GAWG1-5s-s]|uniref:hypothetical protein n=1 Tax=Caballeronia sp. GAWG1-5s-s TaxID=2921743 RepID=UPI002027E5D4|nr:hypothetical protein [Caballeronia sp. GAWG1-5s-s]
MPNGIRPRRGALTVLRRQDAGYKTADEKQQAKRAARVFLSNKLDWIGDEQFLEGARSLLGISEPEAANLRWKIERAIETGELVTVPDTPIKPTPDRPRGGGQSGGEPRSFASGPTFTPSQLFKRAASVLPLAASYVAPAVRQLTAADGPAIWAAEPGDILPDGSIATPVSKSFFADAQPFEYVPDDLGGDVDELAASTNNPRYAAKMLGYSSQQFREMVHRFKTTNGIAADDDLLWHDNGDVYLDGDYIDNFHGYEN